jgi:two-component system LytT family response regulator
MINVIIVDDEKSGRETLQFLLKTHFSDFVNVSAIASNIVEAVEAIRINNVDIVFLDMQMPNESVLSLLNKFSKIDFEVIVTTAHRAYGIDALKAGVSEYLLKPIDLDDLEPILMKVINKCKIDK